MMRVIVMAVIVVMAMIVTMSLAVGRMRVDRRTHHAECVGSEKPCQDGADEGEEYDELIHGAASGLHEIDVFDRDGAAVAEIDDEDGEADRSFGGGDGQDEECEDLPHQI